jgi:AAA family ATP:ADP antiporter
MGAEAVLTQALARVVKVRADEVRAMLWAFVYFFCLLSSYYILRPLRDESGVAAGVGNLQWLFTGTFFVMLAAVPLFGALVTRVPRRRFIPWVYRFFIVNILIFFALLHIEQGRSYIAGAFFMWVSVFNLFVVTVFWGFMADLFKSEQGKRLFGFIAAGGSAGALVGPTLTAALAGPLGPVNLLLISALLLEAAVQCVYRLLQTPQATRPAMAKDGTVQTSNDEIIGGGLLAGLTEIARSPYLLMICCHVLLLSLTSTFLYFQQASIVAAAFDNPAERTQVFALIDLSVGLITIAVQFTVTGRVLVRLGVGIALSSLAVVTMAGFLALAMAPVLGVVIAFQSLKRAVEFGFANPARETLFTVVPREQKYKAKSFIDTAVFRGGDAVNGWIYAGLRGLGLDLSAIALVAVPIAAAWTGLLLTLGRKQEQLAQTQPAE